MFAFTGTIPLSSTKLMIRELRTLTSFRNVGGRIYCARTLRSMSPTTHGRSLVQRASYRNHIREICEVKNRPSSAKAQLPVETKICFATATKLHLRICAYTLINVSPGLGWFSNLISSSVTQHNQSKFSTL